MVIQTSGGEIIGILKKIKDADPADSHHALERSRKEGLRSRLLMWRLSPESMRDDLENIYMLLFRFVGNGFQLALCSVSWLATRQSVGLVPDPIVFPPWSVLLDRGEPCDSCQDTPRVVMLCFLSPMAYRKSTGSAISSRQRSRAEPRNTRPTTTPSSCGATTMAGAREARSMALTIQSLPVVSKCVFIA